MAKIKKSFRLSPDVVEKITESDNESTFVESAIRSFNPKEVKNTISKAKVLEVNVR